MNRALGFHSLISVESFRKANFPLVAELLVWLVKRFDSDVNIPLQISTEDERVQLIRNVAQFMAMKANIKLNTKRLYQADGYAVKELLKITSLLYDALNVKIDDKDDNFNRDNIDMREFDITDKVGELKLSRQLASEITTTGASLFELLGKEVDLRVHRQKSISRQFEITEVEGGIKKAIEMINGDIKETTELINNISATESNLDSKIERRKVEIDRYEKRLQTLKKVRPAFLDEFTALEKELEELFRQYSTKLRCLNHLEKLFSEVERAHYEKQLMLSSPRIETIPFDDKIDPNHEFDDEEFEQGEKFRMKQERPRAGTGGRSRNEKPRAFGEMQPPRSRSASSLDLSSDSESDDLFLDKDEPELMNSEDESLAFEISAKEKKAPSRILTASKAALQTNSDDDF
ncbi:clusterin-associated protein 1 homolog isoform X2 [Coccinella septempunctata]|nr:clusterin-associated protein 1 homolog isoform X2 [Coccinella septempunctata]